MAALIQNYNLSIAEREKDYIKPPFKRYLPVWDGWVVNRENINSLVRQIKYQLQEGRKPIVAVFIES